jgi:hypothetical protein
LITLISKIENPKLKEEYLKKLKKIMTKEVTKPPKPIISLNETLERFSKQKSKAITLSDLQYEISNVKQDIVGLKKEVNDLKINNTKLEQELLIAKVNDCFQEQSSNNEDSKSEHSHEKESNNNLPGDVKIISLINKVCLPKWYAKVHIIVAQDYDIDVIALIDFGVDLNCIQEGLVPSKYFEKSIERLSSASGNKLQINYELNNVHVCQNNFVFISLLCLLRICLKRLFLEFRLLLCFTLSQLNLMVCPLSRWVSLLNFILLIDLILILV